MALPDEKLVHSTKEKLIRKPMNSFFLYKQHVRPMIVEKHGRIPNYKISTIVSEMWKNELPQRKRYFINRAKLLYEEHKKLYPDFKW
ncbi:high mobility group box domain-containing protein, partial [Globomyces pollinis-pini]